MEMCVFCEKEIRISNRRLYDKVCSSCSRRVIVWGYRGTKYLFNLARLNIELPIDAAIKFCESYYVGKASKISDKVAILKMAIKVIGSKTKFIGRVRMYTDYQHLKRANISYHNRHNTKRDKCEMCDTTDNLYLHHIVPVSWGGVEFAPDMVMTVCKKHHIILHQRLRKVLTKELLIQYLSPYSREIITRAKSTI